MGRHHSATGNHRVSRGFVLAVAAVLVVIAAVVGWLALRDHTAREGAAASEACVSGDEVIDVAATPSMSAVMRGLAQDYADTSPVVRDHCVTVTVQERTADEVASALTGTDRGEDATGDPAPGGDTALADPAASSNGTPVLWVAESTLDVDGVKAVAADRLDGEPVPIAASPIVLAAAEDTTPPLGDLSWGDLPARQNDDDLGLAMPSGGDHTATTLALAAAIADADPSSATEPLTAQSVNSNTGSDATTALLGRAPGDPTMTPDDAVAALAEGSTADGVRLVPTTQQHLLSRRHDSAPVPLAAVTPDGATPVADYPAVQLRPATGDDAHDRDVSAAAADFLNFLTAPAQQRALSSAGFLVTDPSAADAGSAPPRPDHILPAPAPDAAAALRDAIDAASTTPVPGPSQSAGATTLLLDVSGSMGATEGGGSRLSNVAGTLESRIRALPPSSSVGLWIYSANLSGTSPYAVIVPTGGLSEQLGGGTTREQALINGLDSAAPRTATHTYRALVAAYDAAVDSYRPGGRNSVLLITDGPNDDQSFLATRRLLDAIGGAASTERPVSVDIIMVGTTEDIDSLQQVADATGGTLTSVPSSVDPGFADAVRKMLG